MVGAGFAGLTAAWRLVQRGVAVTVVEARPRVGGRVWSPELQNGAVVEMGGEWIMPEDRSLRALCGELGVELVDAGVDYRRREPRGARPSTLPEQDEVLRVAADARSALDRDRVASLTVGEFLRSLPVAPEALAHLRARLQGTCAVDLDVVALRSVDAEDLRADPATYSRAASGNDAIAAALRDRLPDVRLEHRALRLRSSDDRVTTSGTARSGPWRLAADAAVVAVPLRLVSDLELDPPLPASQRAALDALPMGVAAKLAFATSEDPPLLSAQSGDLPFWCWTGRGPGRGVRAALTSFAGSPSALRALRAESGDPSTWTSHVRALVPEVALAAGKPLLKSWGDDDLARGSYCAADNASFGRAAPLGAPFGRIAFAGEHVGAPLSSGTMDAAVRSGEAAADTVVALLR